MKNKQKNEKKNKQLNKQLYNGKIYLRNKLEVFHFVWSKRKIAGKKLKNKK